MPIFNPDSRPQGRGPCRGPPLLALVIGHCSVVFCIKVWLLYAPVTRVRCLYITCNANFGGTASLYLPTYQIQVSMKGTNPRCYIHDIGLPSHKIVTMDIFSPLPLIPSTTSQVSIHLTNHLHNRVYELCIQKSLAYQYVSARGHCLARDLHQDLNPQCSYLA